MDLIKEAFSKIKRDMDLLRLEVEELKINQLKSDQIIDQISLLSLKIDKIYGNNINIKTINSPTTPTDTPTDTINSPTTPTDVLIKEQLEGLKTSNYDYSIGNDGVPTNKPTLQQTGSLSRNKQ